MSDRASKTSAYKKSLSLNTDAGAQTKLINRAKSLRGENEPPRRLRSDSIGSLEELVQCGICLERLSLPRMLPCQHTFCLSCLQSHALANAVGETANAPSLVQLKDAVARQKSVIRCPSCNLNVTLEEGVDSLESLPTNVYISSLLHLLESSVEPTTPTVATGSEARCVKCQTICHFEGNKCQHCRQVFCKVCWSQHMNELEEKLQILITELADSETRLAHKVDDFEGRFNQLNEAIKQAADARIAEIKAKESSLLKEVENSKLLEKQVSIRLMEKISELRNNIIIKKTNYKLIDENQKVNIFMTSHRSTSKLLEEISQWGETRTIFDSDSFKLDEDNEGLSSEVEDSQIVNGIRFTSDPLENRDALIAYYKSKSFTAKLHWTKCPRPAGVGVSPWSNHIYIATTDSGVVLILNRHKFKVIGRLTAPDMICPYGIAFSKHRKEIYVTDKWKHCIHVFSSHGDYLKSLCSRGSSEGKVRSPEGIAITSSDELIVCDTGNDRIIIMDPENGRHISTIGWHGKRTILNMPTGVAVSEDKKIVVADSGNHRVKVFNMIGEILLEIGSLGREKGQFRSAEAIAVDPLGFILVGDAGNSRVQIFDSTGYLVRVFGGAGEGVGKFKWISGIAVTPQLEIITTDYKGRSVQIF